MTELIITVLVVMGVSFLSSMLEAIFYAVPASHIEALAHAGSVNGKILKDLRRRIDEPITAILCLNNIANIAGSALAGAVATKVFGETWLGLFSALLTLAILIFSEIIPKTIGVVYCRPLSVLIARPLLFLVWILKPIVWTASFITRVITRGHEHEMISSDELVVMAKMGMHKGVIDKDELAVIQNILLLGEKTVRDVMTPRTVVFALSAYETVKDAGIEGGILTHSRIPVYFKDFEDIEGIVYRRDILTARAEHRFDDTLEQLMKPVHFVYERMRLDKVLKTFLDRAEHLFVVIDEFGGLAGVISLEDVLEEILGREILDEFDKVSDMRKLAQKRRSKVLRQAHNHPPLDDTGQN
ncbi:MAG: hemolysin family protein [Candidatus Zixiibacteriota bacterium]